MDLIRHLSFFVAVAEEGHFGHAAERLGMTQPPLSQGVRRLERRVGTDLVNRGSRGATLTDAGRELLPRARLLVADAQRFEAQARLAAGGRDTGIRWGVTNSVPDGVVVACVQALREHDRGRSTRVFTTTDSTNELVAAVRDGVLDVAVVDHPALLTGLECGRVVTLPRWVVVPAHHLVTTTTKPQLRMLRGLALATRPRSDNQPAHDLLVDILRAKGLDPEVRVAKDVRDLLAQVAAGETFGVSAAPPIALPGVAWVELLADELASRTRIVWRGSIGVETAVHVLDRTLSKAGR